PRRASVLPKRFTSPSATTAGTWVSFSFGGGRRRRRSDGAVVRPGGRSDLIGLPRFRTAHATGRHTHDLPWVSMSPSVRSLRRRLALPASDGVFAEDEIADVHPAVARYFRAAIQ